MGISLLSTATLTELIAQLDQLSVYCTIFAWTDNGRWFPGSSAIIRPTSDYSWHPDEGWAPYPAFPGSPISAQIPEELPPPPEPIPQGFRYFLEVDLARDVVRVAREWFGSANLTAQHEVLAVIYYAEHDAFLDELPAG